MLTKASYSLWEGFKIALGALTANKTRSLLTTLGIVIGVITVTLMMMIIQGLNQSFTKQISSIGSGTVYIQRFPWMIMDDWWVYRNRPRISRQHYENIEKYAKIPDVIAAQTYTVRPISFRSKTAERVGIIGATPSYADASGMVPEYGRFISEVDNRSCRNVCVIGTGIKEQFFDPYNPIGRNLRIGSLEYKVVGILEKQGTTFGESQDNYIFIPLNTLLNNYGQRRDLTILAKVEDPKYMDAMVDELTGIMRRTRKLSPLQDNNFTINKQEALTNFYKNITAGVYAAGLIIGGIALLVGGIGIMNIMLVSVTERTWEIGMRKAVGARTTNILWQFLVESMLICSFGGLVGLSIAALLGKIINQHLPTSLPPWLALFAILFSGTVGLLFGLMPAMRASKLDPITALRQDT